MSHWLTLIVTQIFLIADHLVKGGCQWEWLWQTMWAEGGSGWKAKGGVVQMTALSFFPFCWVTSISISKPIYNCLLTIVTTQVTTPDDMLTTLGDDLKWQRYLSDVNWWHRTTLDDSIWRYLSPKSKVACLAGEHFMASSASLSNSVI
mgnify:CR=1 FL=1